MNQTYLNCPYTGSAMTAEEYAAQYGAGQNCGCGCSNGPAVPPPQQGCCVPAGCQTQSTCGSGSNSNGNGSCGCGGSQNSAGNGGSTCCTCPANPCVPVPLAAYGTASQGVGGFNTGNGVGMAGGFPSGTAAAGYQTGAQTCVPMICTCQPVPYVPQNPAGCNLPLDQGCCCKKSFQAALCLLNNPALANLLNFDAAAFITKTHVAGAVPEAITVGAAASDNLGPAITGSLRRITPCNGDLLEISATLTPVGQTATSDIIATSVSLCSLSAIAIDLAAAEAVGNITAEAVQAQNLRLVQQILAQTAPGANTGASCSCGCAYPACGSSAGTNGTGCGNSCGCGSNACTGNSTGSCGCCTPSQDCCCSNGLMNALAQNNLSRRVSLTAGPLQLNGVTLIGSVGNVLMLSNDTSNRIYFVCVNEVEFLF